MKGAIFHNRYEILDVLGAGGTAIVYKARDIVLNRPVTLKILREQYANDDQFVRRFKHEAQAVACLSHPNIVSIYDVVFDSDSHYLVMEYVEGCTLKQYLEQKGVLPVNETLYIMHQLMDALDHAHKHNVIHRDIKPHNILLDAQMNVKVTDFGIAVAISDITQTYTKDIMGSVHYMSPEQVKGIAITEASDIYSAGVVMYEMLTGTLPFGGENAISVAMQHVQNEVIPPHKINPSVPIELSSVVMKALRKDPAMRFASAKEMQAALADPSRCMDGAAYTAGAGAFGAAADMNTKTINNVMTGAENIEMPKEEPKKRGLSSFIFDEVEVDENGNEINNQKKAKNSAPKSKPHKKQSGSSKKMIVLIVAALLIIAAGAFAASSLLGGGKTVEMPDVVGKQLEDAVQELEAMDIAYTVEYKTNEELEGEEEYEEDEVVEQSVEAGTEIKTGKKVKLIVCSGSGPIEVPNVLGDNVDDAKRVLVDAGFNVIVEEKESDEKAGTVLEQSLKAGSEAEKGDNITIVVSKEAKVEVPNLESLSLEDAKQKLEEKGLSLGEVTQKNSDSYSPNQVMSQNVSPGSEVEKGSKVNVVVSKGPKLESKSIRIDASAYIPDDGGIHSVTINVTDEAGKNQSDTTPNCQYGSTVSKSFTVSGRATVTIKVDGVTVDVLEQ
ncbi:MAG: Stk1 family PASTA domain-containing Ser/Thr kinase [Bacillota bacterium]|jgi:serine/threonine protein kinase/beta-lactam-binding protein with PASTA domain